MTARTASGAWVWGYIVYWRDGRRSSRVPTAESGLFESERTALLYALGFMLGYAEYFMNETVHSLHDREARLLQPSLEL